jgi:hypothetical protein
MITDRRGSGGVFTTECTEGTETRPELKREVQDDARCPAGLESTLSYEIQLGSPILFFGCSLSDFLSVLSVPSVVKHLLRSYPCSSVFIGG